MKISGVYKITNSITGEFYIGSSKNTTKRRNEHFRMLRLKMHPNNKLQKSYDSSPDSIIFEVIEQAEVFLLKKTEQYYFDLLHPNLNICPLSISSKGRKGTLSEQTKLKISLSKKGKPRQHAVKIYKRGQHVSAKKVKRINPHTNEIKIYESLSSVEDDGLFFQNVSAAIRNKRKHHGYIWEYVE